MGRDWDESDRLELTRCHPNTLLAKRGRYKVFGKFKETWA